MRAGLAVGRRVRDLDRPAVEPGSWTKSQSGTMPVCVQAPGAAISTWPCSSALATLRSANSWPEWNTSLVISPVRCLLDLAQEIDDRDVARMAGAVSSDTRILQRLGGAQHGGRGEHGGGGARKGAPGQAECHR